jgi:hypothetical protein
MDDGALKLDLDAALSERLRAAADEAGRTVSDHAAHLIAEGLDNRWSVSVERLTEYDRTGEFVPAEDALARFRSAIKERLRKAG